MKDSNMSNSNRAQRQKLGKEPQKPRAKVYEDNSEVPDMDSFTDHEASAGNHVPTFAEQSAKTLSQQPASHKSIKQEKPPKFLDNMFQKQRYTVFPEKDQWPPLYTFIRGVIWCCYVVGNSQTQPQITPIAYIDFAGIFLAIVLTLYKWICLKKEDFELDDGIHLISLGTTIAIFVYNPENGRSFTTAMYILRAFRVLFPLNFNHYFTHLFFKYGTLLLRIIKVTLPWFLTVFVTALILGQVLYYKMYDRCRPPYNLGSTTFPPATMPLLCGAKQCPSGLQCLNPIRYNITPNSQQFRDNGALAFGFYMLNDLIHSIYTVIALGSLSNTTTVISIFSQAMSPTFFTTIAIIAFFLLQFFGSAALLALIDQFFNSQPANNTPLRRPLQGNNNIPSKLSVNPTFGVLSVKGSQQEPLSFRGESINSPSGLVGSAEMSEVNLKKQVSLTQQKEKTVKNDHEEVKTVNIKCDTLCLLQAVSKIVFCTVQAQMAISYSFKIIDESEREAIGAILASLWALWAIYIILKSMGILFTDNQQDVSYQIQEDRILILNFERAMLAIITADYSFRMARGIPLLTGQSMITPLASSVLLFRVAYIPFMIPEACNYATFQSLKQQVRSYYNVLKVYRVVMTILTIYAVTLGSLCGVFSGDLWQHSPRWLGQLAGGGWHSSPVGQAWIDQPSIGVASLRVIAVIIGQLALFQLMFSDASLTGFFQTQKRKELRAPIYNEDDLSQEQKTELIRGEKSFNLFSFEGCRESLYELLQDQRYTKYKRRAIITYLVATLLAFTVYPENMYATLFLTLFDVLLIIDNVLNAIARRFWGPGSFIDGKWYNVINPAISVFLCFNIKWSWVEQVGFRALRFFLLVELSEQLAEAYSILRDATRRFICILPIFVLNWAVLSLIVAGLLKEYSGSNPGLGFVFSFRVFQRGFDFGSILTSVRGDYNGQLLGYSGFLMFLTIAFPPQALLVGMVLSLLKERNELARDKKIESNLAESRSEEVKFRLLQQYEKTEIQKKLLHLKPQYNFQYGVQNNCLLDMIQTYPHAFWWIQASFILLEAFLLALTHFLREWVSQLQLQHVKTLRLLFLLLSIGTFIVEALAYRGNCQFFYSRTVIFVFALPGAFISVVPFTHIQGSQQMLNVLQFFILVTPLTTLQLFLVFERRGYQVASYLFSKVKITVSLIEFFFGLAFFATGLMMNFTQLALPSIFANILVGMLGGPYEKDIEARMTEKAGVYVVEILIFFMGMITRNAIIAALLYEVLDYFRQIKKDKDHLCITIQEVGTLFNEHKFLKVWKQLDPRASGMLSFKTVVNHLPKLMTCFDLKQAYLEVRMLSKRRAQPEKLAIFRKLHFPIRCGSSFEKGQAPQVEGYVITIHDVAARLLCMALEEQYYRRLGQQTPSNADYKSWAFHLGFDDEEWNHKVHKAINRLNFLRLEANEEEIKYNAPAKVEATSWSLGCVMSVLPKMRRKVQDVKIKLQ